MGGADRPDFATFVDVELPRLLGYAYALTGNDHDAWDLAQEALARVGVRWARIDPSRNPAGYVRRIIVRLNIDRIRSLRREQPTTAPPEGSFEDRYDLGVDPWLVDAMVNLTPRQRTALVLRFVDDLDLAGIAEAMACSVGTAKSHLSRGLKSLRAASAHTGQPATEGG